jgi:hypothetical protein
MKKWITSLSKKVLSSDIVVEPLLYNILIGRKNATFENNYDSYSLFSKALDNYISKTQSLPSCSVEMYPYLLVYCIQYCERALVKDNDTTYTTDTIVVFKLTNSIIWKWNTNESSVDLEKIDQKELCINLKRPNIDVDVKKLISGLIPHTLEFEIQLIESFGFDNSAFEQVIKMAQFYVNTDRGDKVQEFLHSVDENWNTYIKHHQTDLEMFFKGFTFDTSDVRVRKAQSNSFLHVMCLLVLHKKISTITTILMITKKFDFLTDMINWFGYTPNTPGTADDTRTETTPNTKSLLFFAGELQVDELLETVISRIITIMFYKKISDKHQIGHLLDDIIYFNKSLDQKIRAIIFVKALDYTYNLECLQGKIVKNLSEEIFNILYGCKDTLLLSYIRYLVNDFPVSEQISTWLNILVNTPTTIRHVKGHILMMLDQKAVHLIMSNPHTNLDIDDIESFPNLMNRTINLSRSKKLQQIVDDCELLKLILNDTTNSKLLALMDISLIGDGKKLLDL